MMFRKIMLIGCWVAMSCLGINAQTASWSIQPQYSSVEYYSDQLYKVKSGYSTGLVNREGQMIVPIMADSITNMRNGHGLVLKYTDDGRYKLVGVIHQDHTFTNVLQDYYIGNYPFYSEDKMPVYNEKNRLGYIDANGREVTEFNLVEAHPFSEGMASVSKGKGGVLGTIGNVASDLLKASKVKGTLGYIDSKGKFIVIQKSLGKLEQAYSFRHGEALVITEDGRMCFINPRGQFIRQDNNVLIVVDDMYALNPDATNYSQSVKSYIKYNGPTTFSVADKVGYCLGNKVVLPAQFTSAEPFSDNYAIASIDGKFGVLQLWNEEFKASPKISKEGMEQKVVYEMQVPTIWRKEPLKMYCKQSNGLESNSLLPPTESETRVFSFIVPKGDKSMFKLEGNGLLLWEEDLAAGPGKDDLEIKILSTSIKAKSNDIATVSIRVINHSDLDQDFVVYISGERLKSQEKKMSLPAGQSSNVYASYTQVSKTGKYELTVKLSNGKTLTKTITVAPFFNNL